VDSPTLRLIPASLCCFERSHEQSLRLEVLLDLSYRILSSVELLAQAMSVQTITNRKQEQLGDLPFQPPTQHPYWSP
jgi:hypothetical protein